MKQNILISGGASGIGLTMAKLFAGSGAEVWIADSDKDATRDLPFSWGKSILDVADENSVEKMFEEIGQKWGRLDVLCANVGISGPTKPVEEISLAEWQRCISVNLDGAFLFARGAVRLMKNAKAGCIIFTSSTAGIFGYPNRSPYCSSKWALIGLMKTLAMELGPLGIRANAICPGSVEGERMDQVLMRDAKLQNCSSDSMYSMYASGSSMGLFVSAEDVANMALFLSSKSAGRISGQVIAIDGNTENAYPKSEPIRRC